MAQYDYQLKVVVAGETGVGKSCLLAQLCNKEFEPCRPLTVGVDQMYYKTTFLTKTIKLQIFDTAGPARFRNFTRSCYSGTAAAFLVYDVTSRKTFKEVGIWLRDLLMHCEPNTVIMLLGNKCDIEDSREVSRQEGQDFATYNHLLFTEVSATNHSTVSLAAKQIIEAVYNKISSGKLDIGNSSNGVKDKNSLRVEYNDDEVYSD